MYLHYFTEVCANLFDLIFDIDAETLVLLEVNFLGVKHVAKIKQFEVRLYATDPTTGVSKTAICLRLAMSLSPINCCIN
jgi:hypothetical protein